MSSSRRTPTSVKEYKQSKIFTVKWNHSYDDPTTGSTDQRRNVEFDDAVFHDRDNLKVSLKNSFGVEAGTDFVIRRKRNLWTLGILKKGYSPDPIITAINQDARGLTADDLFVFYYSGNGEREGNHFAIANNKPDRFITVKPIFDALAALPCDVLVILDCCNAVDTTEAAGRGPSGKKMIILGASLAQDVTSADAMRSMSRRLRNVLNDWGSSQDVEITVDALRQRVNRNTGRLRQELQDNSIQDAVLFDYTGAGDITLGRE